MFESRYGAEILDSVDYELEVNKYIHLNPVRAKMVSDLADYPWSRYNFDINSESGSMVTTDRIFLFFLSLRLELCKIHFRMTTFLHLLYNIRLFS